MNVPALISQAVLPQMIHANLNNANLTNSIFANENIPDQQSCHIKQYVPSVDFYKEDSLDNFSMSQKDIFLQNIEDQINKKRTMLLKKRKQLNNARKKNEYLEGVRKDYEKYHEYIANNKRQEMNAMFMLKSYIDDLVINGNLTNTDLNSAKMEQQRILKETQTIKDDLDKIIATK